MHKAFQTLVKETYNGKFFISKNVHTVDTTKLTYHALKAANLFGRQAGGDVKGIKHKELIDYFVTKA